MFATTPLEFYGKVIETVRGHTMLQDPDTSHFEVVMNDEQYSILQVQPFQIDDVWAFLEHLLDKEPALWSMGHTKDSIYAGLKMGIPCAWLVVQDGKVLMAFFTEKRVYPFTSVLSIVWGVGSGVKKYVKLVLSAMDKVAADAGCSYVAIEGRVGWTKLIAESGYKPHHVSYLKPILHSRMN